MELDVGQPVLLMPGEGEVVGDSAERRVEILCDREAAVRHVDAVRAGTRRRFGAHPSRPLRSLLRPRGRADVPRRAGTGGARPRCRDARARAAACRSRLPERERQRAALPQFPRPGRRLRRLPPRGDAGFDSQDPPADGGRPAADGVIVPPGTDGVLVDRDEIRIEVRDKPGPASNRLTCLYALENGRFLEIQA